MSGNANAGPQDFSDIRGALAQRYYTTLCIAYGAEVRNVVSSNQFSFGDFVATPGNEAAGDLPMSRAQTCPYEYGKVEQAFGSLFVANYVDGQLLQQVQAFKWGAMLFPTASNRK